MKKRLFVIDGNSYIHRAYHAIRGLRNSDNFPTNAIYGFTNMLMKIMEETPDYIAVVFDAAKKSFRNELYPEYKANRPPMDNDLVVQIPFIKKTVEAFNLPVIVIDNVEADDVIATIVNKFKDDFDVVIISSDKDLMQLISDNVIMWDTLKNIKYTVNNVDDKFGVKKDYIIDYLSLVGDASDNIPGVKGIGPKTAVKLINRFGTVENIYKNIENVTGKKLKTLLENGKENAFLSKTLIRLKNNVELGHSIDSFRLKKPDMGKLQLLFKELEFHSLLKKFGIEEEREEFVYNYTEEIPVEENIAGLILSYSEGFFKQTAAAFTSNGKDVFVTDNFTFFEKLKNKKFITFNYKELLKLYSCEHFSDFEDVALLAYLFDPETKNTLENISQIYCKKYLKPVEDYKIKKNMKIDFSKLRLEEKKEFIASRACAIFESYIFFTENMDADLKFLYNSMEKPLLKILHKMENNGILIDSEILDQLNNSLTIEIEKLTEEIYNVADERFNINSPKQLQKILFEKLGLEKVKKTKTGASTDNEVLEYLSSRHILPKLILAYREKTKIKSTYLEGLTNFIDSKTGRIYPTFNQTVTATGRLSCTNPNIQNIPVKTDYGDKIRKAFVAPKGKLLVSLDYSQIELRLMAHFSEDEELIRAFEKDIDVHCLTASKIYGVEIDKVSAQMRRDGKTVNFAIIYGISAFGLAKSLKVSRDKAKKFIENYFNEYTGVKRYIEKTILEAKEKGYVKTLYNRKRFIKGLTGRNHKEREFAKRVAVNTPIQGTAADIIKLAMVSIDKNEKDFNAKIIMQIHDELIFEVEKSNAEKFVSFAKDIMENITPELKVKLKVDAGMGKNWLEAH